MMMMMMYCSSAVLQRAEVSWLHEAGGFRGPSLRRSGWSSSRWSGRQRRAAGEPRGWSGRGRIGRGRDRRGLQPDGAYPGAMRFKGVVVVVDFPPRVQHPRCRRDTHRRRWRHRSQLGSYSNSYAATIRPTAVKIACKLLLRQWTKTIDSITLAPISLDVTALRVVTRISFNIYYDVVIRF